MRKDQISIQLYTVRELAAADLAETLAKVAAAGYRAVEFAGFQGKTASEVRQLLDKHGLRASSAHIPITEFRARLDGVVEDLTTIGAEWGVVPWVAPEDRSPAALKAMASEFDGFATRLNEAGLKFAYHSHEFECTTRSDDGRTVCEQMVDVTTPGLVSFELDAFWAEVGGYSAAELLRTYPDRIGLVHLKDGRKNNLQPGSDLPFGEGDLDWDAILQAAEAANVEWYVTEQDNPNPADPLGDITAAYRNAEARATS